MSDCQTARCGGCGRWFTPRGLRSHQSARFQTMACRRPGSTHGDLSTEELAAALGHELVEPRA